MTYRREIDGLRALAVLPVMLFHAGVDAVRGGFVGVDVFFVISGYLITSIILHERAAGTFTLTGFYERRARRILPALFTVMVACLPFTYWWLLPGDLAAFGKSLVAVSTFVSNISFWKESGYFATTTELKPLLHTWSLAVEEQYYVLFPLSLLILWRFLTTRWIVAVFAVVAVVSFGLAQWGAYHQPEATFYLLPTRAWELLIGVMVAFYLFDRQIAVPTAVCQAGSLLGFGLLTSAVFLFDTHTPFPSVYALVPTIGTACLILFATPLTWAGKVLGHPAFVGIGLISYSAYLWHQPLLAFARHRESEPAQAVLIGLVLVALFLAFLTWNFIERPCRNRQMVTRPVLVSVLSVVATGLIGLGLASYTTNGFVDRYAEEDRELAGFNVAAAGEYVRRRFHAHMLGAFDGSTKRKVLVIGDSYAEDFVNAVHESDLSSHMQLSTYRISARCGNLFVTRDLSAHIREVDRPHCRGRTSHPTLQQRLKEADVIVLVSAWSEWVVELLPESLDNLKQQSKAQIVVIGRKNFGRIELKKLLQVAPAERHLLRNIPNPEHQSVNSLMQATIPRNTFLDLSTMLCDGQASCPLFTDRGELISYDGSHLTKAGAGYVGQKLSAHPLMGQVMAQP